MKLFSTEPPPPPPLPPSEPTKVIGKAEIYESETKTMVSSLFLNRNDRQSIRARFEVPREQAGENPHSVQMFYHSFSENGFKYEDNHKAAIVLDDKDTIESQANLVMASNNATQENQYNEVILSQPIAFADFEAILKAKDVKIQFGETVFELTPEEKDGLRDLQRTLDK
jgi:hypothetical protein